MELSLILYMHESFQKTLQNLVAFIGYATCQLIASV